MLHMYIFHVFIENIFGITLPLAACSFHIFLLSAKHAAQGFLILNLDCPEIKYNKLKIWSFITPSQKIINSVLF